MATEFAGRTISVKCCDSASASCTTDWLAIGRTSIHIIACTTWPSILPVTDRGPCCNYRKLKTWRHMPDHSEWSAENKVACSASACLLPEDVAHLPGCPVVPGLVAACVACIDPLVSGGLRSALHQWEPVEGHRTHA